MNQTQELRFLTSILLFKNMEYKNHFDQFITSVKLKLNQEKTTVVKDSPREYRLDGRIKSYTEFSDYSSESIDSLKTDIKQKQTNASNELSQETLMSKSWYTLIGQISAYSEILTFIENL